MPPPSETAAARFTTLVPQSYRSFADPILLSREPAAFEIGKSNGGAPRHRYTPFDAKARACR
ncbi:hypothetical protein LA6_005896 (plasmid) [Marinibacterium anthonyi]|nr:hypothetical protein LA6_005896 [Marinibacterium anthonyi]